MIDFIYKHTNESLARCLKSLAMLDAILMPEWQYRYYSYNSKWGEGRSMASMRNGSGDHYFVLLAEENVAIKGFNSEEKSRLEVSDLELEMPGALHVDFLLEPAFSMAELTFVLWKDGNGWHLRPENEQGAGVAAKLLHMMDGDPESYRRWAEDYYEREVSIEAVKRIYDMDPIDADLVEALNPDIGIEDIQDDIEEIAYPRAI